MAVELLASPRQRPTSGTAMTQDALTVLGLESSCDETAAAIVRVSPVGVDVLSEHIATQTDEHALYGGVVPEIAARAHAERIDGLVRLTLEEAGVQIADLSGVAATAGPGLIGGVMVGLSAAKGIALAAGLPFIAVNHLEGHALSPRLDGALAYPYLLLLISGGHCQFISVRGLGDYQRLGSTIDDAVGEAFDKTAKLLGLPMPGGPSVEREAGRGDASAIALPRPLLDRPGLDMSFSGLKTAVRRAALDQPMTSDRLANICASFQSAVADCLGEKSRRAMEQTAAGEGGKSTFVVAGGVAANAAIRTRLESEANKMGFSFRAPPLRWCTDNAAMIALAGAERLQRGWVSPIDAPARARWPLDEQAAAKDPVYGEGARGAKV